MAAKRDAKRDAKREYDSLTLCSVFGTGLVPWVMKGVKGLKVLVLKVLLGPF